MTPDELRKRAEELLHIAYDKSFEAGSPPVADVLIVDAMLAFAAEARREAISECEQKCYDVKKHNDYREYDMACDDCAEAIERLT